MCHNHVECDELGRMCRLEWLELPIATANRAGWNRNPEPSYFWNNLFNGTNQTPTPWSSQMSTYVQLNRDYFVSTGKPAALSSYSAYAYPHPLRLNSGAPGPPTNVMNTVR